MNFTETSEELLLFYKTKIIMRQIYSSSFYQNLDKTFNKPVIFSLQSVIFTSKEIIISI